VASITTTSPVLPSTLTTTTAPSVTQNTAKQDQSQFLQLLVAQLKGQNPLDPQDPTQFVSQLAQFSSLEELTNIRTTLDTMASASTAATGNSTPNPFKGAN